jgi:erlin
VSSCALCVLQVNQLKKSKAWDTVKQYGVDYDKTWIFDKVHHEINQFCSSHTVQEVYIDLFEKLDEALLDALQKDCDTWDTGISLVAIRVTKPRIPDAVRRNYERITEERTSLRVAMEHARVVQAQEEAEKVKATIQAEMRKEVAKLKADQESEVCCVRVCVCVFCFVFVFF